MSARQQARVFSIPPGAPFLPVLVDSLLSGRLVEGFAAASDPLALADATIFVPTRRAARALRSLMVEKLGRRSAILPAIRPLGDFDEEAGLFEAEQSVALDLSPPIGGIDRIIMLAPLVQAWKRRLPAHIAAMYEEDVVVPASVADSVWLARDLAALMDEIETEGADWTKLGKLVPGDLAGWWQVTLEFLSIITGQWPQALAEMQRSNPAAHRNALIEAEAARLARNPPVGPVIAAGSTGSIPATSKLLSVIARLPRGTVVLPGLDKRLDDEAWNMIGDAETSPAVCGHAQFGLRKLLGVLGVRREDVEELGAPAADLAARAALVSEALRPAESTDRWAGSRAEIGQAIAKGALDGVTLVEAANERDEALAIAIALRRAVGEDRSAALVTADRALARRVSAELQRFGIRADDSGGSPLADAPPAVLLRLVLEAVFTPGDPVAILALLKHPLLTLGLHRVEVRRAAEVVELVALRGSPGRPDVTALVGEFDDRLLRISTKKHTPFWLRRLDAGRFDSARRMLAKLQQSVAPLADLRNQGKVTLAAALRASVLALEACGRGPAGDLAELYSGDTGAKLAEFLRSLLAVETELGFAPEELPAVMTALVATETVKPSVQSDARVSIWGALEARLQSVDTLVIGGLNEGSWPRRAEADRFMSRIMKAGMSLEPPERRIGLAAHDFTMAMGAPNVVLTRSARAGDAPSLPSRWLQRLITCAGEKAVGGTRARGAELVGWARAMDEGGNVPFAERPKPRPPLEARPPHFSVTEIETLRRDPYAIYVKKVLKLLPLDPLVRDPGASERGSLFHDILHRFTASVDPNSDDALDRLIAIGRSCFAEAALPADVQAVWWPRFLEMAAEIIKWERNERAGAVSRHAEVAAEKVEVGRTGVTLAGTADRIDIRAEGLADIIDYKTGSSPSKAQAHTLIAPQLALEGALLRRGRFTDIGVNDPSELAYVRLKSRGQVIEETILKYDRKERSPVDLSEDAWSRLEKLLRHYGNAENGYLSRALPFREGDMDGDYDHLARVLEWSAGADDSEDFFEPVP